MPNNLLSSSLGKILLVNIANLASNGQYDQAEKALEDLLRDNEPTPDGLDLLARIYAQQKKWLEAEKAWKKALELEPDNQTYKAGLNRIKRQKGWKKYVPLRYYLTPMIIIAIGSGIYFHPFHLTNSTEAATAIAQISTPTPEEVATPVPTQELAIAPSPTVIVSSTTVPATCSVSTGVNGIKPGNLSVRKRPDDTSNVVGHLNEGEIVVIQRNTDDYRNGWIKIQRDDNSDNLPDLEGWIPSSKCKQ